MHSTIKFFSTFTSQKAGLVMLAPLLTLLTSLGHALVGLVFLLTLDLFTGIRKYLFKNNISANPCKKEFWRAVKSGGLRQTWRKTYEYGIGIIVFAIFESYILQIKPVMIMDTYFTLTEGVIITAGLIELWSNWENIRDVGAPSKFKSAIGGLFELIAKVVPDFLKDIFKKSK